MKESIIVPYVVAARVDTVTREMLQKLRERHGSISAAIRWCVTNAPRDNENGSTFTKAMEA